MRSLPGVAAVVALFPSLASAVIVVRPTNSIPPPGVVPVEVFADASTLLHGFDERLNAFTMSVEAPGFGPVGGDRPWFVIPAPNPDGSITFAEPIGHPYVFGGFPGSSPFDPTGTSDYNTVFLAAALGGADAEVDITDSRNGLARLYVFRPVNTPSGAPRNNKPVRERAR